MPYKIIVAVFILSTLGLATCVAAQESGIVKLPAPKTSGGKALMDCLRERQSLREFSPDKLSIELLSSLLWAADGINRSESGKRTAPSANNVQNIDLCLATADGLFLYLPKEHALRKIFGDDIRAATGTQGFVKDVPLDLVYVADYSKMSGRSDEDKRFYSGTHTGLISQNVYLFCASEGLATVVRGLLDREALAKTMKLRPDQHVTFAQSVGYPKK
jgi:SagB-type dehydrogenase family enzyme